MIMPSKEKYLLPLGKGGINSMTKDITEIMKILKEICPEIATASRSYQLLDIPVKILN